MCACCLLTGTPFPRSVLTYLAFPFRSAERWTDNHSLTHSHTDPRRPFRRPFGRSPNSSYVRNSNSLVARENLFTVYNFTGFFCFVFDFCFLPFRLAATACTPSYVRRFFSLFENLLGLSNALCSVSGAFRLPPPPCPKLDFFD